MKNRVIWLAAACALPTFANAAGVNLNPDISLILSGTYGEFKNDPEAYAISGFPLAEETGPGEEGFSLGESELSISANIDPDWYGQLTVALTGEGEVEVENAFVQTNSFGKGLTLRAGRFFSRIGYLNEQHAHSWDFIDAPLAYRALLGNQLGDDGLQIRWVTPTAIYTELGAEWLRGEAFPAGGGANEGRGIWSAFAHVGGDYNISHSWRVGLSYLSAESDGRITESEAGEDLFTGDSDLIIADFVWKWAPQGNAYDRNLKLQAEYIRRSDEGDFTPAGGAESPLDTAATGWYAQAVYQFVPRWKLGLRHDHLKADDAGVAFDGTVLDTLGHTPSRNSLLLDYAHSEYSRLRLQFNRDESSDDADNQWFLQYQMSLGAHGAHQY